MNKKERFFKYKCLHEKYKREITLEPTLYIYSINEMGATISWNSQIKCISFKIVQNKYKHRWILFPFLCPLIINSFALFCLCYIFFCIFYLKCILILPTCFTKQHSPTTTKKLLDHFNDAIQCYKYFFLFICSIFISL